jgi:hypothetical protein
MRIVQHLYDGFDRIAGLCSRSLRTLGGLPLVFAHL